jgi:hypothetical protein
MSSGGGGLETHVRVRNGDRVRAPPTQTLPGPPPVSAFKSKRRRSWTEANYVAFDAFEGEAGVAARRSRGASA